MSECVVRMELPKGCGYCPIANFGYCSINHKPVADSFMGYPENRPANCPIICPLPEGHGRLVDADRVSLAMVERGQRSNRGKLGEMWELNGPEIREALQTVSTIVPEEAERSETCLD